MPYVARHLIAHPRFNCQQGKVLIGCPSDLLSQFLKDKIIELQPGNGELDVPEQLIPDQDELSPLDQKQLIWVIKNNNLIGLCRPMSNWPLSQIRQCIRDAVGNVSDLKLPSASKELIDAETSPQADPDEAKRFAS